LYLKNFAIQYRVAMRLGYVNFSFGGWQNPSGVSTSTEMAESLDDFRYRVIRNGIAAPLTFSRLEVSRVVGFKRLEPFGSLILDLQFLFDWIESVVWLRNQSTGFLKPGVEFHH
jgi:hypothetical protein